MSDTFNCPNCGAPLDYHGSDPIIRCPYCSTSVVVPDNLRAKPSFSSQPNNFTLSGVGNMGGLINQARRFKEVKDLAQAGNMDEAVRIYSEITGVSPEMARPSVEALARNQPITLSGLNVGDVMGAVRVATAPSVNLKPVDQKTSNSIARWLSCGIGCFVVGVVLFTVLTVLVPTMGGLAGVAVGLKPDLVLTMIPNVPNIPGVGSGYASKELSFGGEGTGPGLFSDVRAIAVDPSSGNIYAADYSGGRVQEFDAQGKFITQWIVEGKNNYIASMAADRKGNVYLVVSGKLLQYNSEGKLIGEVKAGKSIRFDDVAIAADGSLITADGEDIYHITADGKILTQIPAAISSVTGDSELDAKVAVDGVGNIYVLGTFNNAVFKFDSNGKYVNRFGSDGDQPGQFQAPYAIAADGKGRVFISDIKGVQVFGNDGRYINVFKVQYFAYGLTFDDQGKIYVTTNQKMVEKYSLPE